MLAGDWHGNAAWAVDAVEYAGILGFPVIVQLGDFGFWREDDSWGQRYLDKLSDALDNWDVQLFWLDGNHEDHERLQSIPLDPDTGLRPIAERITHLPRGYRWTWHGETWMALGGAASVDRHMRKEGVSWWPGETLTDDDITRAIADGEHVDIVVSHDAPDLVSVPGLERPSSWPDDAIRRSEAHHAMVGSVVDAVGATRLFHGHMHVRYHATRVSESGLVTEVNGLDCDGTSRGANLMSLQLAGLRSSSGE
jgi:hypothetical protein